MAYAALGLFDLRMQLGRGGDPDAMLYAMPVPPPGPATPARDGKRGTYPLVHRGTIKGAAAQLAPTPPDGAGQLEQVFFPLVAPGRPRERPSRPTTRASAYKDEPVRFPRAAERAERRKQANTWIRNAGRRTRDKNADATDARVACKFHRIAADYERRSDARRQLLEQTLATIPTFDVTHVTIKPPILSDRQSF
jgi:hypothetical protein